jgi:hypothetical protein
MSARRLRPSASFVVALLGVAALTGSTSAPVAARSGPGVLVADLEGQAIALARVGELQCDDFDFPRIHCFRTRLALDSAVAGVLSTSAVNYVAIFENISYGGAAMYVSQDYSVLAGIGWNDRISSFKVQNSETGTFYADWFYLGTSYPFCCNSNVSSLGGYNDTFSSILRT